MTRGNLKVGRTETLLFGRTRSRVHSGKNHSENNGWHEQKHFSEWLGHELSRYPNTRDIHSHEKVLWMHKGQSVNCKLRIPNGIWISRTLEHDGILVITNEDQWELWMKILVFGYHIPKYWLVTTLATHWAKQLSLKMRAPESFLSFRSSRDWCRTQSFPLCVPLTWFLLD